MIEGRLRVFPWGSPAHVSHCPRNIDQFFCISSNQRRYWAGIGSIDTSLIIDSIDFSLPASPLSNIPTSSRTRLEWLRLEKVKCKILMLSHLVSSCLISHVEKLNLLYDSESLHNRNCLLGNKNNKLKPGCSLQAGYWLRKLLCQDICWVNSFQFLSEKLKH